MKNLYRILAIMTLVIYFGLSSQSLFAGNKDRAGEAGGMQLLINPWARSNGLGGANSSFVKGLEGQFWNVAGMAHTKNTEIIFTQTQWLKGSGTNISAFGFSKKLGENSGVIGISVMSISYGDIKVTTVESPEGNLGTFSPKMMNLSLSYAKAFSNSIYGGINIKILSESVSNVSASGVAIDAGIQYVTGKKEQVKFGVALKNVGPNMMYSGDALSFRGYVPGAANAMTVDQRAARYELPSLIRIAFGYDFHIDDKNVLTPGYNFTANSFTKDQHSLGLQYAYSKYLVLRLGYVYESGNENLSYNTSALTGLVGGLSLQVPLNKEGGVMSFDYSYMDSNPFSGSHSVGVRVDL
jgi:hypothetical protein